MTKNINIRLFGGKPLPPKWAWWIALRLPNKVVQAVMLRVASSGGALAEKGLDATLRELLIDIQGVEDVEYDKPTSASIKHEDKENS